MSSSKSLWFESRSFRRFSSNSACGSVSACLKARIWQGMLPGCSRQNGVVAAAPRGLEEKAECSNRSALPVDFSLKYRNTLTPVKQVIRCRLAEVMARTKFKYVGGRKGEDRTTELLEERELRLVAMRDERRSRWAELKRRPDEV